MRLRTLRAERALHARDTERDVRVAPAERPRVHARETVGRDDCHAQRDVLVREPRRVLEVGETLRLRQLGLASLVPEELARDVLAASGGSRLSATRRWRLRDRRLALSAREGTAPNLLHLRRGRGVLRICRRISRASPEAVGFALDWLFLRVDEPRHTFCICDAAAVCSVLVAAAGLGGEGEALAAGGVLPSSPSLGTADGGVAPAPPGVLPLRAKDPRHPRGARSSGSLASPPVGGVTGGVLDRRAKEARHPLGSGTASSSACAVTPSLDGGVAPSPAAYSPRRANGRSKRAAQLQRAPPSAPRRRTAASSPGVSFPDA